MLLPPILEITVTRYRLVGTRNGCANSVGGGGGGRTITLGSQVMINYMQRGKLNSVLHSRGKFKEERKNAP
jgi:hypothetical protein